MIRNFIFTARNQIRCKSIVVLYPVFLRYFSSECKMAQQKKALVFLAPGAEEMEFVISADVLRRGGIHVTVAGFPDKSLVKCSREVMISPDIGIQDAADSGPYDAIVLPGGLGGAKQLSESLEVGKLLKDQEENGRLIAAICAAPTVLKEHKIGLGKSLTSYPSFEKVLSEGGLYCYKQEEVVEDGNLITSRGPGITFQFALTVVKYLVGIEKARDVAAAMLVSFSA